MTDFGNQFPSAALRALLVVVVILFSAPRYTAALAQCSPQWQPFDPTTAGLRGASSYVRATTMWDSDGAGPLPPRLVVGGGFTRIGNTTANKVATYDLATGQFAPLGSGIEAALSDSVLALVALPNGDLIAGGLFYPVNQPTMNHIARWNGSEWLPLGQGINGEVRALAVLPNGDLIAGGVFTRAGSVNTTNIARWNGSTWSSFGSGLSGPGSAVNTLLPLANGEVIAGGYFLTAGGASISTLARWNGSAWSRFGPGVEGEVYTLVRLRTGDIVAGGLLAVGGGINIHRVARWTGTAWEMIGTMADGAVNQLIELSNGDVLAIGRFSGVNGVPNVTRVARWNGSSWLRFGLHPVDQVIGTLYTVTELPDGDFVVGGSNFGETSSILSMSGVDTENIARWNGSAWTSLGSPANEAVYALRSMPNGDLYAAGAFSVIGGANANRIAKWNGSSWLPLGTGLARTDAQAAYASALITLPNGDVVVGGTFSTAGGVTVNSVARWNGSSWAPFGSGMMSRNGEMASVLSFLLLPNGDLIAGGGFSFADGLPAEGIARWDGSSWSSLGSGMNGYVDALTLLPNGDLVAAGSFSTAGGRPAARIARWDGSTWSPLGSGLNGRIFALATMPNGDVVAGGSFSVSGLHKIARWNGVTWSPIGTGFPSGSSGDAVYSLFLLPDGDLLAAGGQLGVNSVSRWDGSRWSILGGALPFAIVFDLALLPNQDIVAGGSFGITPSRLDAPNIARWGPPRFFVSEQPVDTEIRLGSSIALSAAVNPGVVGVNIQWQRNGVDIRNGTGGASVQGGNVSGAAGPLPSPSTSDPITLTISDAQPSDTGTFTAVFTNACGTTTSAPATVTVLPPTCDSLDFNRDGLFTSDQDLIDFLAVLAGGACSNHPNCNDIDFNNDGLFPSDDDLISFLRVLAGGSC